MQQKHEDQAEQIEDYQLLEKELKMQILNLEE